MRCLVKSYNERNPRFVLLRHAPRIKSLQPKFAEEPSEVPARLIECQHVAVLSVRREPLENEVCAFVFLLLALLKRLGIQASHPVVWYEVGLVRPAKTAPKQSQTKVRAALTRDCQ